MNENLTLIRIAEKYSTLKDVITYFNVFRKNMFTSNNHEYIYINSKKCNKNSLPIIFNHGILIGSGIKD